MRGWGRWQCRFQQKPQSSPYILKLNQQNEKRVSGLTLKRRRRYSDVLTKNSRLDLQLNTTISVIHHMKAARDTDVDILTSKKKTTLLLSPEKMSQFALLHLQAPVLYHLVGVCNFRGQTEIAWPIKRQEEKKKTSLTIRQRQTFRAVNAFRSHS